MTTTPPAKVGLVVSLVAKPDKVSDLENFLLKGYELAKKEPETLQWFAVKYPTIENQYAIIDTFAAHKGRVAHLEGPIAAALMEHAPTLLGSQPDIMQAEVLASHIKTSNPTDLKVGLRVFVTAKEGMEEEVKDFLLVSLRFDNYVRNCAHTVPGRALFHWPKGNLSRHSGWP